LITPPPGSEGGLQERSGMANIVEELKEKTRKKSRKPGETFSWGSS
jgi:hypothetical protein